MLRKLAIIIPCYNEEKGISKVITNIPYRKIFNFGYETEIIVVDNNSKDNTFKIAKKLGAKVISETKQGKGNAMIKGFTTLSNDIDIVVMIDGDNTYDISEIIRLIEPIDSNFCDVVIGTRLGGKASKNSMTYFNRIGNWILTFLVRIGYKGNVTDVCSGFFAWKKEVIDDLLPHLNSSGFSIEMEMIAKMAKMKKEMFCVPISYDNREGKSTLKPVRDGLKIALVWAKNLFWKKDTTIIHESNSEISYYYKKIGE